jgi:hypothetical protein
MNDLGSGSNVDLCVITKDGVEYLRNYEYLQVGAGRGFLVPVGERSVLATGSRG